MQSNVVQARAAHFTQVLTLSSKKAVRDLGHHYPVAISASLNGSMVLM